MWQIRIPKTEATVKEATLAKWHKREGEKVVEGEVIAEVETFKAIIEVISPGDGIFFKRMVDEGETIPINSVIAVLAEEDEDISPEILNTLSEAKGENITAPASKGVLIKGEQGPSDTPTDVSHVATKTNDIVEPKYSLARKIKVAPAARRLAREKNIDLSLVKGSGPRGAITKNDVENYLWGKSYFSIKETRTLTSIQRITAQRLTLSYQTIPQFTLFRNVDIARIVKIKDDVHAEQGVRLSLVDFVLKSLVYGLKKFPQFNAVFEADTHKLIEQINIGLAVTTNKGLVVSVLKGLREKTIIEIAQMRIAFTDQALQEKLQPKDFEEGTFTLTNLGLYGIQSFTPLINPPQVAILGTGKATESLLPLSLTVDHRVIHGAQGAEFLQFISGRLTSSYRLLV